MMTCPLSDLKKYYSCHMDYVPAQPRVRRDVLASLLERNAGDVAAQQDWEAEWNTHGLTSRLTEEVSNRWKETIFEICTTVEHVAHCSVFNLSLQG